MLCIWFDIEGIVHYKLLERNLTVTTERYCQQFRHLDEAIQEKRQGRRHEVVLQHDNARLHTANMTKAAIQELDWEIFPHPPYSRTLPHRITTSSAPCPTICAEFPSTTTLSSKIGSTTSSRKNRRISSSVGWKPYPNVERQS
jgi:hypothetical protein